MHPKQIQRWRNQLLEEGVNILPTKLAHLPLELEFLKKKLKKRLEDRINTIKSSNELLSINCQCDLLGVSRSTYYYKLILESEYNLMLMKEMDRLYLNNPAYGSRLMTASLLQKGFQLNHKRAFSLLITPINIGSFAYYFF